MKKELFPILLLAISLTACSNNKSTSSSVEPVNQYDRSSLSIACPTGAPALAFYNYVSYTNFETNTAPANIVAAMNAGQKDVVVLPTNAGIQAIVNKSAPYKIAVTITFGNFYIASLGNDSNSVMDASDTILLFQKGNVPDKLFHYVYGNDLDAGIHYVEAVTDASRALITGSFMDADTGDSLVPNYVLIAEPALTTVQKQKETVKVYANIQEEYKKKTNDLEIFQASVFVKNSLSSETVDSFLASLKNDVTNVLRDPTLLTKALGKYAEAQAMYGVVPQTAEKVLLNGNGLGLGFKNAKENKASIDNFLSLFNIAETNEAIYY